MTPLAAASAGLLPDVANSTARRRRGQRGARLAFAAPFPALHVASFSSRGRRRRAQLACPAVTGMRLRRSLPTCAAALPAGRGPAAGRVFGVPCAPPAPAAAAAAAAAEIAAAVAAGCDALVLGRGRRGRVAAALAGARARRSRAVLVLVPRFAAVDAAVRDAREAYPEARVLPVVDVAMRPAALPKGNRARAAGKGDVCVVVGTMHAVGDTFLRDQRGVDWLHAVELLVMHDIRALSDPADSRMIRKLVRTCTVNSALVVVIADSLERLPPRCIAPTVLREGYRCINWFDAPQHRVTDPRSVSQRYAVVHPSRLIPALVEVLSDCFAGPEEQPCKVIVYFPTARLTQFFSEILSSMGLNLCELHSAKKKSHRAHALEEFHSHSHTALFTSDAVWQGADLEEISRVIQVGLALHARAYNDRVCEVSPGGSCLTILCDFEEDAFLASGCLSTSSRAVAARMQVRGLGGDAVATRVSRQIDKARGALEYRVKLRAYASWLASYKSNMARLGWDQQMLVKRAWQWSRAVAGMERPPTLPVRIAEKLELCGVPGIDVDFGPDPEELRKTDQRKPDMHGKFKKRKPMRRLYYASRYLVDGEDQLNVFRGV